MVAPGHPRVVSPVVIDRTAELASIEAALEAVRAGRARTILVAGESGVGKTRLVEEALRRAASSGFRVLQGSCLALGRDIPYVPFAEMLRTLIDELTPADRHLILRPATHELTLLVPELAVTEMRAAPRPARDDAGPAALSTRRWQGAEDSPGLARLRLFEALIKVAERLADRGPIVALVEDLQWADEASLALLAYLRHGLRRRPILLLLTTRSDDATGPGLDYVADLERDIDVERLDLSSLSVEDTGRQLTAILDQRPDPAVVREIHRLSGGNPFYTEELLVAHRHDVPAAVSSPGPVVPKSVGAMARARLARLREGTQGLLRVLSSTDRAVDGGVLASVAAMPAMDFELALREALDSQWLIRVPDGTGSGYRFRHELMRAYVASDVSPTEAARNHAAFAAVLGSMPAARRSVAELAHHRDAAGDAPGALEAHVAAASEAGASFAFENVHRHLERAISLWELVPDAGLRVGLDHPHLLQRAADAAAHAGQMGRAVELVRMALAEAETRDREFFEYLRSGLRWYLWQAGRTEQALDEAERAVADAGDTEPDRWRANALGHLAGLLLVTGHLVGARRRAHEALVVAQRVSAWEEEGLARGILGWCLVQSGMVDEGVSEIRTVLETAILRVPAHLAGTALAYVQLAGVLEITGRLGEAASEAAAGADWAAAHGLMSIFEQPLRGIRARVLYQQGEWQQVVDITASEPGLGQADGGPLGLCVAAALVGAATDDDTALDEAMLAARGEAGRPMLDDPRGWLIAAAAERALWRGDLDAALDWLDGGRDRVTVQRMSASGSWTPTSIPSADASLPRRLALRARAIADARILDRLAGRATGEDAGSAEAVAAEIRRMERHRGISRAARAELACARAELARGVRMRPSAEARAWERAVTVAAQEQRPYAEAYARWRLAEAALAAHADRARATTEVARGMALAASLGASSLRRELELLARRARLTVVGPTIGATKEAGGQSPSPFALTERELEVIGLLAVGATNREIGARLFISPRTASVHVSNILAKLGASNRTEAAALAHRLGIDGHGGTP